MARLVIVLEVEGLHPSLVDPHVIVEALTGVAVGDDLDDGPELLELARYRDEMVDDAELRLRVTSAEWED